MRRLILFLATLSLAACTSTTTQPSNTSSTATQTSASAVTMKTYTNAVGGYTISYPEGWTVQENTAFVGPDSSEVGTVFTPPASDTDGTNLVQAQVEVAALDGACPVISSAQQEPPMTIDNLSFEYDLWGTVSGGDTKETLTYQTPHAGKCYRMVYYRYFCTPGSTCTADRTAHFAPGPQVHLFQAMAKSFIVR